MQIDLAGRVKNINLPTSRPLLPLFEAIINSIQAIEEADELKGDIHITLHRDPQNLFSETDQNSSEVFSFDITDNGVGFTDENFSAFQTSDTTHKAKLGGKGIGRLSWLVAFDRVKITSTFKAGTKWLTRSFEFVPVDDGVQSETIVESSVPKRSTTVQLHGFKEKFRSVAPKRADTIGTYIVEHCLEYLMRPAPPRIILQEGPSGEILDLNDLFEREMASNTSTTKFRVGQHEFGARHIRLYSPHIKYHLLHFCANGRVVCSDKLLGRVPNLSQRLTDEDGGEFVYACYIDSAFLDSVVNAERTGFLLPDDGDDQMLGSTGWTAIREAALDEVRAYLAPFTELIREVKKRRIEEFVSTQAPRYRPILTYVQDDIDLIDPDAGEDQLDAKLNKAYHGLQIKLREEGASLIKDELSIDQMESKYRDFFAKISAVNQADLAEYVFHRRVVLQFIQKLLSVQPSGKYAPEGRVHSLIFPMGKTSDEVPFQEHNLWLVDERLAYHRFLSSDRQLRVTEPLINDSSKEPDIIVFDKACAFVGSNDAPFQTVTIIEFKKPMRTAYPDDDNPFDQVLEYVDIIRNGKAKDGSGRHVPVSPGVHFYCYIVADMTANLEQAARREDLQKTPDGQGFYGYKKNFNAYVEFISYDKLVKDALQRNQVFFDKLGLPSNFSSMSAATENSKGKQWWGVANGKIGQASTQAGVSDPAGSPADHD